MSFKKEAKRERAGFTLIELLVVIAIIAILIALLLPAIQRVRIAAMRTQSTSNLKQLALACNVYQDAYKSLPWAGGTGNSSVANNTDQTTGSWAYQILPYIEQSALYESATGSVFNSTARVRVPVLMNPVIGRPGFRTTTPTAGDQSTADGPNCDYSINPMLNTNGYDSTSSITPGAGDTIVKNFKRSVKSLQDGASNTVLLGDQYIPTDSYDDANFGASIMAYSTANGGGGATNQSYLARGIPIIVQNGPSTVVPANNYYGTGGNYALPISTAGTWMKNCQHWGGAFSEGCFVATADGAIHIIPYDFNFASGATKNYADVTVFMNPSDGVAPFPN